MHDGPHYKLRRLASTHPFESASELEDEDNNDIGSFHDALASHFFMRPPDEEHALKYGEVVHDILETVDLLHMSLISLQNTHPLLEVLELANNCRRVVNRLSESISDPILFAGPFAEYYLHFLRLSSVDENRAVANIRFAMGGGIPSVIQACENLREKIIEAKRVFRIAAAELSRFLLAHDKIDARMSTTHPFTLKNVQTLNLVLYKFDQLDQFCRSYEEYFGHEQFRHLHNLLHDFEQGTILRPPRQEQEAMINLWIRYERFTLHFPNELDMMTEFFQSNGGGYTVRSTGLTPTPTESPSIYTQHEEESLHGWRGFFHGRMISSERIGLLKRETRKMKNWIRGKTSRSYHHIMFWFQKKGVD
ncbi:hypothetical protein D9756_009555 [Leucocoprinus leucothites]|uniref:Uncharacterized protein n=1 Tax=Leucocoprinus leucothites TaxID=201217 RepID=A0A8H5FTH1_9AGAR|nr:hypothetical protein D9756_009555 [Leucoagaricus leucothites]